MRGRCGIKVIKGGQMIKHSRWKGCEGDGRKIKNRKMMELSQNNEMRWKSRDWREVRLVKTSGEREERWLE